LLELDLRGQELAEVSLLSEIATVLVRLLEVIIVAIAARVAIGGGNEAR